MGTPDELRPLAKQVHNAGWTVQGLLLPGFGSEIDTLFTRQRSEWTGAVRQALIELQKRHRPVILVGYSMGAAVAMEVAAKIAVDGLILLAPFWRIGSTKQRLIWQVLKRFSPQFQPFKKADFADPRLHEFFAETMPELDLDDPEVQAAFRQLEVPARFVDQVLDMGKAAEQVTTSIATPTHIIQGTKDEMVTPQRTRQLLQKLTGPVTYEELITDHGLVKDNNPGFERMTQSVLAYARRLAKLDINGLAYA
jgi:carboxylesterase